MKVRSIMTRSVQTCRPMDSLATAAKILWDHDCGALPVVDSKKRAVGMLTDRDICMAALVQGAPLKALAVSGSMSRQLFFCKPEDDLHSVERILREKRVRRLPVIDSEGRLVGIVAVGDLVRLAEERPQDVDSGDIAYTLWAIGVRPGAQAHGAPRQPAL